MCKNNINDTNYNQELKIICVRVVEENNSYKDNYLFYTDMMEKLIKLYDVYKYQLSNANEISSLINQYKDYIVQSIPITISDQESQNYINNLYQLRTQIIKWADQINKISIDVSMQ